MCVIERKTYLHADGRQEVVEKTRLCSRAHGNRLCNNVESRDVAPARIVETRPAQMKWGTVRGVEFVGTDGDLTTDSGYGGSEDHRPSFTTTDRNLSHNRMRAKSDAYRGDRNPSSHYAANSEDPSASISATSLARAKPPALVAAGNLSDDYNDRPPPKLPSKLERRLSSTPSRSDRSSGAADTVWRQTPDSRAQNRRNARLARAQSAKLSQFDALSTRRAQDASSEQRPVPSSHSMNSPFAGTFKYVGGLSSEEEDAPSPSYHGEKTAAHNQPKTLSTSSAHEEKPSALDRWPQRRLQRLNTEQRMQELREKWSDSLHPPSPPVLPHIRPQAPAWDWENGKEDDASVAQPPPLNIPPSRARRQLAARLAAKTEGSTLDAADASSHAKHESLASTLGPEFLLPDSIGNAVIPLGLHDPAYDTAREPRSLDGTVDDYRPGAELFMDYYDGPPTSRLDPALMLSVSEPSQSQPEGKASTLSSARSSSNAPSQQSESSSSATRSFDCDTCDQGFRREEDWKRHDRTSHVVHGEYFRCRMCNYDNRGLDKVQEHCRAKHGQAKGQELYETAHGPPPASRRVSHEANQTAKSPTATSDSAGEVPLFDAEGNLVLADFPIVSQRDPASTMPYHLSDRPPTPGKYSIVGHARDSELSSAAGGLQDHSTSDEPPRPSETGQAEGRTLYDDASPPRYPLSNEPSYHSAKPWSHSDSPRHDGSSEMMNFSMSADIEQRHIDDPAFHRKFQAYMALLIEERQTAVNEQQAVDVYRPPSPASTGSPTHSEYGGSDDGNSIWSLDSIASSVTSVSGANVSDATICRAVDVLFHTPTLAVLYRSSLEAWDIDQWKLHTSLRRMVQHCGSAFRDEVTSSDERVAARLLRASSVAARIASEVVNRCPHPEETVERTKREKSSQDPDSDAEADNDVSEPEDDDSELADVESKQLQATLEAVQGSQAYRQYRIQLLTMVHAAYERDIVACLNDNAETESRSARKTKARRWRELSWVPPELFRFVDAERDSLSGTIKCWVEDVTRQSWHWWPLEQPKRRMPQGHVRVTWLTPCGSHRCIDLTRERAQKLKAALSTAPTFLSTIVDSTQWPQVWTCTHGTGGGNAGQPSKPSPAYIPLQKLQSQTKPATTPSAGAAPVSAQSHGGQSTNTSNQAPLTARYVYLCTKTYGKRAFRVLRIHELQTDGKVFTALKREFVRAKGLLHCLSIWRYSHCDFFKFKKTALGSATVRLDFPDAKDANYDFAPRPIDDPPPDGPIAPDEFEAWFYHYSEECSHRWYQVQLRHLIGVCNDTAATEALPKRILELDIDDGQREDFWGLLVRERVSGLVVLAYLVLANTPAVVFFFLWLFAWGHGGDLQNATVPLTTSLTLTLAVVGYLYAACQAEAG